MPHPLDFGNMIWAPEKITLPQVVGKDGLPWKGTVHPKRSIEMSLENSNGSVKGFLSSWMSAVKETPRKETPVDLMLVTTGERYVIQTRRQKGGSMKQRKRKFQQARQQTTVVIKSEKFSNVTPVADSSLTTAINEAALSAIKIEAIKIFCEKESEKIIKESHRPSIRF